MLALQRIALNVVLYPVLVLMAAGTLATLGYLTSLELIDRATGAKRLSQGSRAASTVER